MGDSSISIKSFNLEKNEDNEVSITLTFLDESELVLKAKIQDNNKVIPLKLSDELVVEAIKAIDPKIIPIINKFIVSMP